MSGIIVAKIPYYGASKDKCHENIESQYKFNRVPILEPFLLNNVRMY